MVYIGKRKGGFVSQVSSKSRLNTNRGDHERPRRAEKHANDE